MPAGTARGASATHPGVVQGRFKGLDLTLVKPLTFMNESGLAVRKVLAREHAPLSELLVVADDFALPFGKLRFREGGGPGGHNGLGSIIDELGTEKFSRLRIGIGEPDRNAVDHVLSTFAPDERQRLDELLDEAADAVEALGARRHQQGRQPLQQLPAAPGRRPARGASGGGRRAARPGRGPADADGLASPPPGEGRARMSTPPLRGKRGAERRLGERLADEFVARHRVSTEETVDFDVAEVDREVEDAERAEADAERPTRPSRATAERTSRVGRPRRCARRRPPPP